MGKHIVYKWHRDGSTGMINNIGDNNPNKLIEKGQREMKEQGFATGISWKIIEGSLVDAMIETKRL